MQRYSFWHETVHVHAWDNSVAESMVLFVPLEKVVSQRRHLLYRGHFQTSGTLKRPTSSLLMIWHNTWLCRDMTSTNQTEEDCLNISLLVFMGRLQTYLFASTIYVWPNRRFARFWRIAHLGVCGIPEALAAYLAANICLLLCNGILAAAFLIQRFWLAGTFFVVPLSPWTPVLRVIQKQYNDHD